MLLYRNLRLFYSTILGGVANQVLVNSVVFCLSPMFVLPRFPIYLPQDFLYKESLEVLSLCLFNRKTENITVFLLEYRFYKSVSVGRVGGKMEFERISKTKLTFQNEALRIE